MADDRLEHALRQSTCRISNRRQRLLRGGLDLGKVVATLAHHHPKVRVSRSRFFRRCYLLLALPTQLAVQGEHMLEHIVGNFGADTKLRQTQVSHDRISLRFGQSDLELSPPAGWLAAHQLV